MSEFDIRTTTLAEGALLFDAHSVRKGIVLDATARNPMDRDDTQVPIGTPIAALSSGKYMPVRRGVVVSAEYDGSTATTIKLSTSPSCFAVGDVIQGYTHGDAAGTDLGAITAVDDAALTVKVAGDKRTDVAAGDYIDVTANGKGTEALILLETAEVAPAGTPQDTTGVALVHGFVIGDKINAPAGADAQLLDDLAGTIYVDV